MTFSLMISTDEEIDAKDSFVDVEKCVTEDMATITMEDATTVIVDVDAMNLYVDVEKYN